MTYKILSIEDTSSFRRLIRMTLEFEGFDVIEAEGGQRGLELARARIPDLILLDLMMPDIGGLVVCQELKKDAGLRNIPIIVLSSSDDSNEIEECLQLGAQGYLLKPFRPAMLLQIVRDNIKPKTASGRLQGPGAAAPAS